MVLLLWCYYCYGIIVMVYLYGLLMYFTLHKPVANVLRRRIFSSHRLKKKTKGAPERGDVASLALQNRGLLHVLRESRACWQMHITIHYTAARLRDHMIN